MPLNDLPKEKGGGLVVGMGFVGVRGSDEKRIGFCFGWKEQASKLVGKFRGKGQCAVGEAVVGKGYAKVASSRLCLLLPQGRVALGCSIG